MKIISIVGARPQFIKLSPIVRAQNKYYRDVNHIILHTGQHYDYTMNKIFFDELGLPEPQYNLEVGSVNHGMQTGLMLSRIEEVLLKEEPDWVLVYGDTNSTIAAALSAAKLHIPVAHIEAGLRSYNKNMPEEVNRVLTDHMSTILFCPTHQAIDNLRKEGFSNILFNGSLASKTSLQSAEMTANIDTPIVINTGDVMYDAVLLSLEIANCRSTILKTLGLTPKNYFLATIHRAENTDNDDMLLNIINSFNEIAISKEIIFPLHPRTRKKLRNVSLLNINPRVRICEPVGYFDMLMLLQNAERIFTDSGGIQKEAYILGTPCITLRNQTEWIETVNDGLNVICGTNRDKIIEASRRPFNASRKSEAYGDGIASDSILLTLLNLHKSSGSSAINN
jgi:UDP-N-acetylglucosamine 2-epimerase